MKIISKRVYVAIASSLVLAGCASTTGGSVTGGDRRQLLLVSEQEVIQASQQAYAAQNAKASAQGILIKSGSEYNRVRGIMQRLAQQVAVFRPDAARWGWDLSLLNANEVNAYVMPGGKVTFYTGMIRQLRLTDDEIAMVMGHEMAHALREHTREQISQQMAGDMALSLGGALLGVSDSSMKVAGLAKAVAVDMPFSRNMETEADTFGLELAARAGYNPTSALSLWDKMATVGGGQGPTFLSSHPSGPDRKARISAALPRVMPLYEAARGR